VIDTPGILDHPLDERNTIEMQSITAMAHLQAAILFVLDISEQCGYTIKQQVALFQSIKPLFVGKPIVVAVNKIDVARPESIDPADWALVESLQDPAQGGVGGVQIVPMSTLTEEGVTNVKQVACDALLEARVEKKLKTNKITGTLNRLHVAMPARRDDKQRPPTAPPVKDKEMDDLHVPKEERQRGFKDETTFARMQRLFEERLKQEQEEAEMWSRGQVPGMNTTTWKERYDLKDPEWKFDKIPEILDGQNIADFVDADINELLEELEREEDERVAKLEEEKANRSSESELDEEEVRILNAIRKKKTLLRKEHQLNKGKLGLREIKNKERTLDDLKTHLRGRGFDTEQTETAIEGIRAERSRSASRTGRKRERSSSRNPEEENMTELEKKKARRESRSKSRLLSLTPKPGSGMKDLNEALKAQDKARAARVKFNREGRKGESDRHISSKMPKHLFSGKRGIGKTDRR
jgi:nucleolar GTP-binding protein